MKISSIKTDVALEKSGVWIPFVEGSKVRVRRVGNPEYKRYMDEAFEPYRQLILEGRLPADVATQVERQAKARHVLVDWSDFHDDRGEVIRYSPEQAYDFFCDPELHDFEKFVDVMSTRLELFRRKQSKEDLGNSRSSSNGQSSTDPSRGDSVTQQASESKSKHSRKSQRSQST